MKKLLPAILAIIAVLTSCAQPAANTPDEMDRLYPLVENTTAAMMNPEYWSKDGKVLMTADEIAAFNSENELALVTDGERKLKLSELDTELTGQAVRELILLEDLPEADTKYGEDGNALGGDFVSMLDKSRNLGEIADKVSPRYAIVTERVVGRLFPTDLVYYDEPGDFYYPSNVSAELYSGEGVAAVHTSADGKWSFVITRSFTCWVPNEVLAFCHSASEWKDAVAPSEYLTVTGDKIIIDAIPGATKEYTAIAYMGMKLKLAGEVSDDVNGRSPFSAYTVLLPSRDGDGMLSYMAATVAASQDVVVGSLPLTGANIVAQAFRFLGHTYGWGGEFGENDCSGMARQVMKCFGFDFPRNSSAIAAVTGLERHELAEDMSHDDRMKLFSSLPAGTVMQFRGHIMIFLGVRDGTAYCISSCGAFVPESSGDAGVFDAVTVNCVCLTPMDVYRANGRSWADNIAVCIELKTAK